MSDYEIKIKGWKCNRCGHEWTPRNAKKPKVCPSCKSPYWSSERVRKIKNKA